MNFKEIDIKSLSFNPFTLIGDEWMLISAGEESKFNTMTASWGGVGVLWKKPVTFCFVRPQRYTFEFMENNDYYSLSFFDPDMKPALSFCGTNSGKDVDKIKATGLIPKFDAQAPYFEQAKTVFICRKLYNQFILPDLFLDASIEKDVYPQKDYHRVYVGEIVKVLKKDD
ncbi:MAG: flavin reductase [Clostridia bacterium]|nr:flavin reductase [Clostridia bacterium]